MPSTRVLFGASESQANWQWLIDYGMALSAEYTDRYGKIHKSQGVIEWCRDQNISLPSCGLTPFAQAMPPQYRNECVVTAYRDYYMGEKERIATWKYSLRPDWWNPRNEKGGSSSAVEPHVANVDVAGSNPVSRSIFQ